MIVQLPSPALIACRRSLLLNDLVVVKVPKPTYVYHTAKSAIGSEKLADSAGLARIAKKGGGFSPANACVSGYIYVQYIHSRGGALSPGKDYGTWGVEPPLAAPKWGVSPFFGRERKSERRTKKGKNIKTEGCKEHRR